MKHKIREFLYSGLGNWNVTFGETKLAVYNPGKYNIVLMGIWWGPYKKCVKSMNT
jgi:hypothetical protein